MSRWGCHALRDERGVSLVELVIAGTMSVFLLGAVVHVHLAGDRSQRRSVERARTTQDVTAAGERLTTEIRNATAVSIVSGTRIDIETPVRGAAAASAPRRVVYDCSAAQRCTRQEGPVGGALNGRVDTILSGVQNADVFTGTPGAANPRYVALKLAVSVGTARPVHFHDGVTVRRLGP